MAEVEEEYDELDESTMVRDKSIKPPNTEQNSKLSVLNEYIEINDCESGNPVETPHIELPQYAVPRKQHRRNYKDVVILPDDYSLAGSCILSPDSDAKVDVGKSTVVTEEMPSVKGSEEMPCKDSVITDRIINNEAEIPSVSETKCCENDIADNEINLTNGNDKTDDVELFVDNDIYSGKQEYDGENPDDIVDEVVFAENDIYNKD